MKTKLILACLILGGLTGCGSQDALKTYLIYTGASELTIKALTILKKAGEFTPDEIESINEKIDMLEVYRSQWRTAIDMGEPSTAYEAFKQLLDELIEIQLQKEGGI